MLDTFPKTTVDVFALILESGGCKLLIIIVIHSDSLISKFLVYVKFCISVYISCNLPFSTMPIVSTSFLIKEIY